MYLVCLNSSDLFVIWMEVSTEIFLQFRSRAGGLLNLEKKHLGKIDTRLPFLRD